MNKILQLTLLYDFYGELLTQRQRQIYEMYYQSDLSLSEIGQELEISRQAVRDQLKKAEKILLDYENKLGLLQRFVTQQNAIKHLKSLIENLEKFDIPKAVAAQVEEIKKTAEEILEQGG